jgi:hypothetical protein
MASDTSIVRSQVFFIAQAARYGVARSPRLIEKGHHAGGGVGIRGSDNVCRARAQDDLGRGAICGAIPGSYCVWAVASAAGRVAARASTEGGASRCVE